ncbi:hypothetical protein WJX73_002251 [Symbiochloris irregularis]|uniref:RRM domain-containing protein n=1 Tax=Symbiochloris irregularis TaxID=706552 RepID=A0AAW1P7X6_9CHLO
MAAEEQEQEVMRIGKRCFVGNLAWKTSWQDLKDMFRSVGDVVFANVMRDDTGRSKGWGIVEFDTPEHAVEAVKTLNGQELAGRKLLVREDREDRDVKQFNKENGIEGSAPPRPPRRPRRPPNGAAQPAPEGEEGAESGNKQQTGVQIVVQGIPWKYEWKDLKDLFASHEPTYADVVMSKDGRSRGYGTVAFNTPAAAQKAIHDFHGSELEGRTLTVKLDKFAQ